MGETSVALFTGHITNKLDRKGRISVPAGFRSTLGKQTFHGIAAYPSLDGTNAIEGSGIDMLQNLSDRFSNANPFSPEFRNAKLALFSNIDQLPFDSEGRISLPTRLIELANLSSQASFVGLGATFQIWEPEAFKAARKQAMQRAYKELAKLELPPSQISGEKNDSSR
ncbi:MAG: division/cell wall cluster transcriptional repressor MraZ [Gammaproteobacteria bacterium]|nr:division/cell wall cluster transcriptional repressor MraZ [Gammaproteobacteria bacterium]